MKTYVKIYGPPLMKALDQLEKIAKKMPKITHYHFLIGYPGYSGLTGPSSQDTTMGEPYLAGTALVGGTDAQKVTHSVISKSGHTLGEYDFFFEWNEEPTWKDMRELISKIDKTFTKLRCKYTLTSK